MGQYKIYGDSYQLRDAPEGAVFGYAIKGKLVDLQPKGKYLGYVTMEDGSVIECYKAKPIALILSILIALLLCGGGITAYFLFFQPKDVVIQTPGDSTPIVVKQGDDNNVVSYNGFTSVKDGNLNLDFKNGNFPCTITVSGEGIDTTTVTVEPGGYIPTIPITFTTDAGLVPATLTITTDTSTTDQDFVIEIPENNTPNSPEGSLDGYWKGEYIYVPPVPTE